MDGWMDGWMDESKDSGMKEWMVGWMDGWMVGWMDGTIKGWMEGRMDRWMEGMKEMFHLMIHSTHFIYGYMASDIWWRIIQIAREETHCCHMGYSFWLVARVLLYASSHRQHSTKHGLCYTSREALAGYSKHVFRDPMGRCNLLTHCPRLTAQVARCVTGERALTVWQESVL